MAGLCSWNDVAPDPAQSIGIEEADRIQHERGLLFWETFPPFLQELGQFIIGNQVWRFAHLFGQNGDFGHVALLELWRQVLRLHIGK